MTLEEELAPYRMWYSSELEALEIRWAAELSAHIDRIGRIIHPLPVSQGWINKIKTEACSITVEHNLRVAELDAEFMEKTATIWAKYEVNDD
jgi:hypothetical protein